MQIATLIKPLILSIFILSVSLNTEITNVPSATYFGESIVNDLQEDPIYSLKWDTSCPAHQGSLEQQAVVCTAWDISHDKTFIYLIKAENGQLTYQRKHPGGHWCARTKRMEYDYGFGVSRCYHPEIVNNPRYFTDVRWNLQQTYNLYKGGVKFYGKANIWKVKKHFKF